MTYRDLTGQLITSHLQLYTVEITCHKADKQYIISVRWHAEVKCRGDISDTGGKGADKLFMND